MPNRITEPLPGFMRWETVRALVGSRRTESLVAFPENEAQCREVLAFCRRNRLTVCPRGSGHSYGDLALNDRHVLLCTTRMNRIMAFDERTGRMTVEPGVRIIDIYRRAHHKRFALPASPTEGIITVAGAIAANVNGKDSWRRGNFGDRVVSLKLLTASGRTIAIDRDEDRELFLAVVGGLGLLGVVLEATIQLERVPSPFLEITRVPVPNLEALLDHLAGVEATSDFAVIWLDVCARGEALGRGVVHATRWVARDATGAELREEVAASLRRLAARRRQALALFNVVKWMFSALLQAPRLTVRFFNALYYFYCRARRPLHAAVNVEKFLRYNFDTSFTVPPASTTCGPLGYTIQVTVPRDDARAAITEMIRICQAAPCPPVMTIMRLHRRDDHLLSFSEDGYSLNFEFHPKRRHAAGMRRHADALVECAIRRSGKVHLAKEMILRRDQFQRLYPRYREYLAVKARLDPDEIFASDLYRRLIRVEERAPAAKPAEVHVVAAAGLREPA